MRYFKRFTLAMAMMAPVSAQAGDLRGYANLSANPQRLQGLINDEYDQIRDSVVYWPAPMTSVNVSQAQSNYAVANAQQQFSAPTYQAAAALPYDRIGQHVAPGFWVGPANEGEREVESNYRAAQVFHLTHVDPEWLDQHLAGVGNAYVVVDQLGKQWLVRAQDRDSALREVRKAQDGALTQPGIRVTDEAVAGMGAAPAGMGWRKSR